MYRYKHVMVVHLALKLSVRSLNIVLLPLNVFQNMFLHIQPTRFCTFKHFTACKFLSQREIPRHYFRMLSLLALKCLSLLSFLYSLKPVFFPIGFSFPHKSV